MNTTVGRAFEPKGRNIISGFETLSTRAEPGLLRVVRVLGLCGGELYGNMTYWLLLADGTVGFSVRVSLIGSKNDEEQ